MSVADCGSKADENHGKYLLGIAGVAKAPVIEKLNDNSRAWRQFLVARSLEQRKTPLGEYVPWECRALALRRIDGVNAVFPAPTLP